jgi:hypothetical protein
MDDPERPAPQILKNCRRETCIVLFLLFYLISSSAGRASICRATSECNASNRNFYAALQQSQED